MGFFRQQYWSGLPFPSPGDLPDPGIQPISLMSSALQADSLLAELSGNLIRLMLALWNKFGGFPLLYFGRIWEILILILWIFGRIHQWSHVVQKNFFGRLSITNLIFVCVCVRIFRYCFFMIQSYRLHMCVCVCVQIFINVISFSLIPLS